jgi:hypothetical protein
MLALTAGAGSTATPSNPAGAGDGLGVGAHRGSVDGGFTIPYYTVALA